MVTWNQATPPPAGVAYEWAGEPHNSESIKYVDGVEVARNIIQNPSFEDPDPLAGVMTSSTTATISSVATAHTVHVGSRGLGVVVENANASQGWIAQDSASFSPSGWIAMSVRARNSVGMAPGLRFYFNFYDASGGSLDPSGYVGGDVIGSNAEPGDMTVLTVATPIPAGATRARAFLRPSGAVTFGRYHTDAWIAAVGATEAGALAQVEEYFDGSFEDDREGDIWVNSSTGAFHSWGGASRGWVARDDDKANHLLGDNRLDVSYLTSPDGGSAGDHRGHFDGRWSHPDGDSAIIRVIDTYKKEQYPNVYPSMRVVVEGDATKLGDGGDPILMLRPSLDDPRNVGATRDHHIKVTPGDEMVFKAGLNYSWSDTTMFRDEGIQILIGLTDINGSWKATRFSPTVPAANINSTPTPIEYTFTVPNGVEWAYVIVNIVAPAQTRTGPGALYFTDLYFGTTNPSRSGASEVGVATVARRGLVSETFARSREKIDLQLAEPDERLKGGERIELAAFAASSSEVTWRWRQVTGPEVTLVREGNTCHFQAPDVSNPTDMRIAVSATSVDGANRSDWHFFDLEILPTVGRFAAEGSDGFLPYTPQMVGYNRGKREIWNDVIAPVGMDPEGRKEPKLVDLGIPADDVTFSLDGEEPARASAGAVYVDIRDGAIYRNFGGGYNETDDTTGAPRRNAYMVNPATGEVFEWIEEADDGR